MLIFSQLLGQNEDEHIEKAIAVLEQQETPWNTFYVSDDTYEGTMQTKEPNYLPQLPEDNVKMTGPAPDTNHIIPGRVYNGP